MLIINKYERIEKPDITNQILTLSSLLNLQRKKIANIIKSSVVETIAPDG